MGERQMRSGFTTGTCAAVAAKAAAAFLLSGQRMKRVGVMTPKGTEVCLEIEEQEAGPGWARCAVKKDAGDDPDVTHGCLIYAKVRYIEKQEGADLSWYASERYPHLYLTGGAGIGRVTKPGLSCPVGKAAINPVPRRMILEAVGEVWEKEESLAPLLIEISIPDGVHLAAKTFNPKLGVLGGISVLGTSGVVEPMSEAALVETIRLEIRMRAASGMEILLLTPGNYGEEFLAGSLGLSLGRAVRCSNFVEEALKAAAAEGFNKLLFVGHLGKLVKVAGGVGNTHSRYGDGRMESLWECVKAGCGGEGALLEKMAREEIAWEAAAQEDELQETDAQENEVRETGAQEDEVREAGAQENEVRGAAAQEDEVGEAGTRKLEGRILRANTTEEAAGILEAAGLLEPAMAEVVRRVQAHLAAWAGGKAEVEVMTFSTVCGILGKTGGAEAMIASLREIGQ